MALGVMPQRERQKKVALEPVSEDVLVAKYGRGRYSAIPCFVHTQACGKERRIDNAKKSKGNATTQYTEGFWLSNACAPALSARMLPQAGRKQGLPPEVMLRLLHLESGGEDLPDAFRSIPVVAAYLHRNVVMVHHPETGRLKFVQVSAAPFGQGSSVYSFERWSAFLGAAPRRLLLLL